MQELCVPVPVGYVRGSMRRTGGRQAAWWGPQFRISWRAPDWFSCSWIFLSW